MKVYGNIEAVKKAIETKFGTEIAQINEESNKIIAEANKEADRKMAVQHARTKTMLEAEDKKAYAKIMSEERLAAKKAFEQKREELINAVFAEAEKRASEIATNKKYIDFVKKNMPKEPKMTMVAGSDVYKKSFPEMDLKVDKSVAGIKFVAGNAEYDFTLDGAIKSRRELLRHKLSKVLFEE